MVSFLDFEKPIAELEGRIEGLRQMSTDNDAKVADEVLKLEARANQMVRSIYSKLSPWQKTQVARHPDRPHFENYIEELFVDYTELAGDRCFGDDVAILGGLAEFRGRSVVVIGHEKGSDTASRVAHNFGMARPEGYRKAVRLMDLANRFGLPVITLVDTAGAYPGIDAEERGQAEAIARSIECCLRLEVPLIAVIVGEGGSGGAVALASGNKVIMMEHSIYSVISPEGCASILWHSSENAQAAASALKLTAQDLLELEVVDQVIEEPAGGAHRDRAQTIESVGDAIERALESLSELDGAQLKTHRREKFLTIGGLNSV
ncbi:MAG TPA: acetyl-CoA carboxylase carboxyltransferase subunit alpha [Sneathiellales bacterium]|nr:acetyl-CoA carboxylase carboxyltransferase subunit alpha [Sneathiellales bacterium]